jgi:putative phage-type endonuclease
MTTSDFHNERKTGIGGSDAASIMKMSPYSSPLNVYMHKTGEIEPEEDNEYTRYGKKMERIIVEYFEEDTGLKVNRDVCKNLYRHKKFPFLLAHIDGFIDSENAGFEAKTNDVRSSSFEDDVPEYYKIQCQHYMNVLDVDYWYLAVLKGVTFKKYKLTRDPEFIHYMQDAEINFWENNVIKRVPPVAWITDKGCIDICFNKNEDKNNENRRIVLRDSLIEKLDLRIVLNKRIESDTISTKEIENIVRQEMIGYNIASCGDYEITYKPNKNGARTLRINKK